MRVVLASKNAGKLQEFAYMLADTPLKMQSASAWQVPEVAETANSFVENALLKARAFAKACQLPALADDSGLVVPALGGKPGIHSARFAGTPSNDAANNAKLLAALGDSPQRQAYFHCTLVLVQSYEDPAPIIAQGNWHGEIATKAQGDHGFGYDPLFYLAQYQQTAAQLPAALKNQISHRAQALAQLAQFLNHEHA